MQYLLAADRNNEALGDLYTPLHPAVLRLLRDVIATARARGKPVAVCGEMAGDALFVPVLLALGLDEFSLHPGDAAGSAPRDPRAGPGRTADARAGAAARARSRRHREMDAASDGVILRRHDLDARSRHEPRGWASRDVTGDNARMNA